MIDFWGILGNAATDDAFRNNMFNTFIDSTAAENTANPFSCIFKPADYDACRNLVVAKIGVASLMSLGEWLVLSIVHPTSGPALDAVASRVQAMLSGYTSTNPIFFQTLGAGIVDPAFRTVFNSGAEAQFGFVLTPPDRAALAPIMADGVFGNQSDNFHSIGWSHACKDMVFQSTGDAYAHALEDKFPQ